MKSLSDAMKLRNQLIAVLEEADAERSAQTRRQLLSVAVAGAGFAGVETLASINDFLRVSIPFYRNLVDDDLTLTLAHPGEVILPELSTSKLCPKTAQHGLRQGKVAAQNIAAWYRGGAFVPFYFKTIG